MPGANERLCRETAAGDVAAARSAAPNTATSNAVWITGRLTVSPIPSVTLPVSVDVKEFVDGAS